MLIPADVVFEPVHSVPQKLDCCFRLQENDSLQSLRSIVGQVNQLAL